MKYQHPSHRTPKIWRWPELAFFRTETFQLWNNSKPANTWKLKMLAKSSGQILWPNAARNQNHWNEAGPKSSKVAFQMQLRHMSASSLKKSTSHMATKLKKSCKPTKGQGLRSLKCWAIRKLSLTITNHKIISNIYLYL